MLFASLYRYIFFRVPFKLVEVIRCAHKSCTTYAIWCFSINILGSRLTGDNHLFHGSKNDTHVTLGEDEKLEKFDDNVNSAVCSCVNRVWNYYQSHGPRFYQAPRHFYPVHSYKTRGSFVGEPSPIIKKYSFEIL